MSESLFNTHRYVIPFDKYDEPIYLIPVGDVHHDAPLFARERWNEFLSWAKTKKRCYFLGMGDYGDMASGSERRVIYDDRLHESTRETIEDVQRKASTKMANELLFSKGRWIGMLEGNHYGKFKDGTTTTQILCNMLDTTYLGYTSFIRLVFKDMHGNRTTSLDLWAHHGSGGGGRLVGGSVNSVQHMADNAEADIYLSGHDHKKWVAMKNRLVLTDGGSGRLNLRHKKIMMVRTGSFLKGYEPGAESYVARAGMSPTDLGVVKIELTPKRDKHSSGQGQNRISTDRVYIDLHASI